MQIDREGIHNKRHNLKGKSKPEIEIERPDSRADLSPSFSYPLCNALPRPFHRWRSQRMVEDYVNLVGDIMYPKVGFGPYGYDITNVSEDDL